MITAMDLVALFFLAFDQEWGYIWGAAGVKWTEAKQAAATRETTVRYGGQWIGRMVADCSGLGAWAFRQLGSYLYHGSNTIWNQYVTEKTELRNGLRADGGELLEGDPVFKRRKENGKWNRHHIGYYVGGGRVIEAKGTRYGVVQSNVTEWDETAHWIGVEYEGGEIWMTRETVRMGSSGAAVRDLQLLLNNDGYGLAVDGKFGQKTKNALMMYQKSHGLAADGVAGADTWDALLGEEKAQDSSGTMAVQRSDLERIRLILDKYLN
ncbi:MAG: peptidoglycan-binding protein [Clostridia bacterium]|nr:peptidoglycan-binding protein [Clostridia bacterium]